MTLSAGYSLSQTKTQVAKVLMEKSGDASAQRQQLAQRDIASLLGVGWEMVHASLESLENDGVIRVERHRVIINKELLNSLIYSDKT